MPPGCSFHPALPVRARGPQEGRPEVWSRPAARPRPQGRVPAAGPRRAGRCGRSCVRAQDARGRDRASAGSRDDAVAFRRGPPARRCRARERHRRRALVEVRELQALPDPQRLLIQRQVGAGPGRRRRRLRRAARRDARPGGRVGLRQVHHRRRLITRLLTPTAGTISFEGRDITGPRRRSSSALRREMQMIFQDPYSSLNPRKTVGDDRRRAVRHPRR